jgi:alpha-beta hydrolase superfamily lysophospholipase
VVLVGGSGPQDLNEAIGPNKPFRDLAQGLARAGVASLRYDKRTYDYGKTWGDKGGYDVDSEVTDDAVAAAQLLAAQPAIDPHRVFVLGHSLGAMLAPRIGTRDPHLAGLVMLAAPARSLLDVMAEQTREMGRRQGLSAAAIEQQMKAFDKERKLLAGAGKGTAPSGDFGHIPQAYWVSLRGGEQVTLARSLSMPMLLLQGESDFQVSPKLDFAHWEDMLAGRHDITFHAYPGLNHLFLPAGKSGSMADYLVPGHVAPDVVADVAAWIKAQPSTRPGMPWPARAGRCQLPGAENGAPFAIIGRSPPP